MVMVDDLVNGEIDFSYRSLSLCLLPCQQTSSTRYCPIKKSSVQSGRTEGEERPAKELRDIRLFHGTDDDKEGFNKSYAPALNYEHLVISMRQHDTY